MICLISPTEIGSTPAKGSSSEKTGAVGEALGRYVSYRQRMDEVRQKIVSASIYPLLLLVACCMPWDCC